ncbi:thymidine kinase [bacterium AH-315-J23]|nr:thymidine kinase [bacterium AH-315-J23]PHQ67182.1 MAG: thymidine kinase [Robiginitomaculum sp.]
MAKLYFNYSAMNAGKSTVLLQASHNYHEQGMHTLLMTAALDDRTQVGQITSRIGLGKEADLFEESTDVFASISARHEENPINCVMIDEAQFLSPDQVWQLSRVTDELRIPVLCYGLRTDFMGELFPGSAALLALADHLREIRTICWCGSKASMVLRMDGTGNAVKAGTQVVIGGNDVYASVCRKHWKSGDPHKEAG